MAGCAFFFFNDTATTEIYTLSLHDALPISREAGAAPRTLCLRDGPARAPRDRRRAGGRTVHASARDRARRGRPADGRVGIRRGAPGEPFVLRSEEHTSELQSHLNLVCRLLL